MLIPRFALGLACLSLNIINKIHIKQPDLHALWLGLLRVSNGLSLTCFSHEVRVLTLLFCFIVNRQISELRDKFDWPSLRNGKVVDIGGGSGHVSIELARVSLYLIDQMCFDRCLNLTRLTKWINTAISKP